jgi:DNA-binding beta-propeller fold protein YncE
MTAAKKLQSTLAGFAGEAEGAWDLSYAYYNPPESVAWDISTAEYFASSISVTTEEGAPRKLWFKPDGTKMFITGNLDDKVWEYALSVPFFVNSAVDVASFSVSAQDTGPQGMCFSPDGTKFYVVSNASDAVNEYSMSTAWDITTASHVQTQSIITNSPSALGVFFKPDGTRMYIAEGSNNDIVEYSLSTAWDVSTISYVQKFSIVTQSPGGQDVFFKPDGTSFFVMCASNDSVNEYSMSTAWDISTASYVQSFNVNAQETAPIGLWFDAHGGLMFICGTGTDSVYQYHLGGFYVGAQEASPLGFTFKDDGTKMYLCGLSGDDVNEYNLSTAWDVSSASYSQVFSVATQENTPESIVFKPDGTAFYIVGAGSDRVNQYNLSTAWDVSTAGFYQYFSIVTQDDDVTGLYFKPDGTKFYICGNENDTVYEYDLSTAWDVSTASYSQGFSVTAQEIVPEGVFFKPDGTKMFIVGSAGDGVDEYDLSTAWDVSTASHSQYLGMRPTGYKQSDIFFHPDGTTMYILDAGEDKIFTYSLGVQE